MSDRQVGSEAWRASPTGTAFGLTGECRYAAPG